MSEEQKMLLSWFNGEGRTITREEISERVGINRGALKNLLNTEDAIYDLKFETLRTLIGIYNEDTERLEELA